MKLDTSAPFWSISHNPANDSAPIDVLSDAFEEEWLPSLGPTTTALVRYCSRLLVTRSLIRMDPFDIAYNIGAVNRGVDGPFLHAFKNAGRFGLIDITTPTAFSVVSAIAERDTPMSVRDRARVIWDVPDRQARQALDNYRNTVHSGRGLS